jgi:dTDP-4-amino-4,6-dideoxygalactose transaminase
MDPTQDTRHVPLVDLFAQYSAMAADIHAAIETVLNRTDFILGKDVAQFEEEFATYCETGYAVGVDSGTSALELILRACGIGPGDEVITAANTFIATCLAISYTGATPVLVDVDPKTYTLDVALLEQAISQRTKAVIPVHLYGHPADMDPINAFAEKHGLVVIEDACQAHGARYKGKRVGSLGHAAAFSFYPAKNLGGYGDGGAVVTQDAQIAETIKMLRNYGQSEKYHHLVRGYNHRLDTLQAAILRAKLKYLDGWNEARRQLARLYSRHLSGSPVVVPVEASFAEPVYHLYVIQAPSREQLMSHLNEKGIATAIHYPIPIHLQPAYQDLAYPPGSFPVTEQLAGRLLSLPMYAELPPDMVERVSEGIREGLLSGEGVSPVLPKMGTAGD